MIKRNKGKVKKALKPSQRESITGFSSKYGTGTTYEEKMKLRRVMRWIVIAVCIFLLIGAGYFLADTLIGITELPLK